MFNSDISLRKTDLVFGPHENLRDEWKFTEVFAKRDLTFLGFSKFLYRINV